MPPRRDSFRRNRVAPLTILFYRFRTTLVRAAREASARPVTIHWVALHQVEHFGLRSSRRRGLRLGFLLQEAAVASKATALLPEPTISRTAAASQSRITTLLWQQNRPCTSCSRENSLEKSCPPITTFHRIAKMSINVGTPAVAYSRCRVASPNFTTCVDASSAIGTSAPR